MKYAIVEDDVIVNTVEAVAPLASNWLPMPDGAAKGWVKGSKGNWVAPAVPEPEVTVPETILRWQAVRALRLTSDPKSPGKTCLETVEMLGEAIESLYVRADLQNALYNVLTWRRNSPTLDLIAGAAGWDSAFVDSMFMTAQTYDL